MSLPNPAAGWLKTSTTVLLLALAAYGVAATALWRIAVAEKTSASVQLATAAAALDTCAQTNQAQTTARNVLADRLDACVGREQAVNELASMADSKLRLADQLAADAARTRREASEHAIQTDPGCASIRTAVVCGAATDSLRDAVEALRR